MSKIQGCWKVSNLCLGAWPRPGRVCTLSSLASWPSPKRSLGPHLLWVYTMQTTVIALVFHKCVSSEREDVLTNSAS